MEYLVQMEYSSDLIGRDKVPTTDVAQFIEKVSEYNWLHANNKIELVTTSLAKLRTRIFDTTWLKECIPIGSIEFVEEVLKQSHGIYKLEPEKLYSIWTEFKYWNRRKIVVSDISSVPELYSKWEVDKLFIKSASKLKDDFTDIYSKNIKLPDKQGIDIFVSEVLDLVSEWRVFVHKGVIMDIRRYSGDIWQLPSKETINDIISALGSSIPAYTLDVGVDTSGRTSIIEVHNFISCGLYGAELPISMYRQAYLYELSKHK